uniref:Uncharacterized protein n=1 Tax=uncultured marine virus TaxID=186617 RepID=A0A0F7LAP7_9VIRU|nr:hypothetical protein [uncultured marine virus]
MCGHTFHFFFSACPSASAVAFWSFPSCSFFTVVKSSLIFSIFTSAFVPSLELFAAFSTESNSSVSLKLHSPDLILINFVILYPFWQPLFCVSL